MSTENSASNISGVCEECGQTSAALMVSSNGAKLCPDCCDDQEGALETIAADQLGEGLLSQLCQGCGTISDNLLTTAENTRLCADCYWKEESQRATLDSSPTGSPLAGAVSAETDSGSDSDSDFAAATLAEIPPIPTPPLHTGGGPGNCEECGKGTLKRLPTSDGRLLCERCVWDAEQNQSTLALGDVPEGQAGSAEGTCEVCGQTNVSLLAVSDGRRLCGDCYIDQER